MGDMPELIAKGPILKALDTVLNTGNRAQIKQDLQDLPSQALPPTALLDLADTHNMNLDAGQKYHIKQDWLINNQWLAQPVQPIVRLALIEALNRAGPNTPIDCYWVCHPGHGGPAAPASGAPLEVSISWSNNQVTVIFHTPEPPWPQTASYTMTQPEDIVVVKEGPGGPAVVPVPGS